MIELTRHETDDPEFVQLIEQVVRGAALQCRAQEVYVVKIDNWFGSRWVGFSHKLLGLAGVHKRNDYVVPPFHPNRVVEELRFTKGPTGFAPSESRRRLQIRQPGTRNRRRLASDYFTNAMLFWWSGNSEANQRGALMCYFPGREGHQGWYCGWDRGESWRSCEVLKVSKSKIDELQTIGASVAGVYHPDAQ